MSSSDRVSLSVLTCCRVAVVFAIQSWLAETPEQAKTASTPAYFQVGMSGKTPSSNIGRVTDQVAAMSLLVVSPSVLEHTA